MAPPSSPSWHVGVSIGTVSNDHLLGQSGHLSLSQVLTEPVLEYTVGSGTVVVPGCGVIVGIRSRVVHSDIFSSDITYSNVFKASHDEHGNAENAPKVL